MTVRNLDVLFSPKSLALIGASNRPGSVGSVLARNLFHTGFEGPIMPVNPKARAIEGVLAYPDVASLPVIPDLAVIATPPGPIPRLIGQLAERGTRAAVVITAGFGEGGDEEGHALRQRMLDAARPHLLRIIGPNCVGILVPGVNLNASFGQLSPLPGDIAFVTQSGAMVTSVMDWATPRGIGFSHLVCLGDMADVDFGDMLDFLANDEGTRAILLYMEGVTHARKFMSAARRAARTKPVIVVKGGREPEGAKAAASHTGSLSGSDEVYDAAFCRAGMLRVYEMDELFDATATLALARPPQGNRLAIVTNGGGVGVLSADALSAMGGRLATLAPETIEGLNRVLPRIWSHGNPVDIIGDAPPDRCRNAVQVLRKDPNFDGLLMLYCPNAVTTSTAAAEAVADLLADYDRTVLTAWIGDRSAEEGRRLFRAKQVPTYETPSQAVRAFMHMVRYRENQELLAETPESVRQDVSPDTARAQAVIDGALADGREWLTEPEAKEVLAAYDIPTVTTHVAADPDEAAQIAAGLGTPVALKILSPQITHKSDVGGVALDLAAPGEVRDIASGMLERVRELHPDARLDGFTVSPMVRRPGAYELILGMVEDVQFGPYLLFGQGGTAVEVIQDTAIALPPLTMHLARDLMSRTRIFKLLEGFRDRPRAAIADVALTLLKVSQLVIDLPRVIELDINPLLADEHGVLALDARVRARATDRTGPQRLSIRPYPKELEQICTLADGTRLQLRPVVPEDEPAFHEMFGMLTPEDVRMRFRAELKELTHVMAARLTQLDYDREMALVLCEPESRPGQSPIFGVARLWADADNERAEAAMAVRSDMKGRGLGALLLERIIGYARSRGTGALFADALAENEPVLKLCQSMGFRVAPLEGEPGTVRCTLDLAARGAPDRLGS